MPECAQAPSVEVHDIASFRRTCQAFDHVGNGLTVRSRCPGCLFVGDRQTKPGEFSRLRFSSFAERKAQT
jgi:hypothetical protein